MTPSAYAMIRRCAGLSAAMRLTAARPLRARWAASRRNGSRHLRTFLLLLTCPADGSILCTPAVRRAAFCSTWIRASARRMANRRTAPGTAITIAPATTRCSSSTSSAIWNVARCVPAMSTAPTAGETCSSRSSRATRARCRASISGPTRASQIPRSTSTSKPRGSSTRSACRQQRFAGEDRLPAQAARRSAAERCPALVCQLPLSGGKLDKAPPRRRQSRVASGRTYSARWIYRHQHVAHRRECGRLLQQARHL